MDKHFCRTNRRLDKEKKNVELQNPLDFLVLYAALKISCTKARMIFPSNKTNSFVMGTAELTKFLTQCDLFHDLLCILDLLVHSDVCFYIHTYN